VTARLAPMLLVKARPVPEGPAPSGASPAVPLWVSPRSRSDRGSAGPVNTPAAGRPLARGTPRPTSRAPDGTIPCRSPNPRRCPSVARVTAGATSTPVGSPVRWTRPRRRVRSPESRARATLPSCRGRPRPRFPRAAESRTPLRAVLPTSRRVAPERCPSSRPAVRACRHAEPVRFPTRSSTVVSIYRPGAETCRLSRPRVTQATSQVGPPVWRRICRCTATRTCHRGARACHPRSRAAPGRVPRPSRTAIPTCRRGVRGCSPTRRLAATPTGRLVWLQQHPVTPRAATPTSRHTAPRPGPRRPAAAGAATCRPTARRAAPTCRRKAPDRFRVAQVRSRRGPDRSCPAPARSRVAPDRFRVPQVRARRGPDRSRVPQARSRKALDRSRVPQARSRKALDRFRVAPDGCPARRSERPSPAATSPVTRGRTSRMAAGDLRSRNQPAGTTTRRPMPADPAARPCRRLLPDRADRSPPCPAPTARASARVTPTRPAAPGRTSRIPTTRPSPSRVAAGTVAPTPMTTRPARSTGVRFRVAGQAAGPRRSTRLTIQAQVDAV
jgi:hypothetical protein